MQQISYNSVEDITDDIRKQIGWRIQEKRIEKGITAVDLSTYLNITANQVSRIERGCAGIDIYKLIVICKILGVVLQQVGQRKTLQKITKIMQIF